MDHLRVIAIVTSSDVDMLGRQYPEQENRRDTSSSRESSTMDVQHR